MRPTREILLDASTLDQVINAHYLDVINELAAHVERMSQQRLPSTVAGLRVIVMHALRQSGASIRQIAGTLGVTKGLVQRNLKKDTL